MFTGIVQGKANILKLIKHPSDSFLSLVIQFPRGALVNLTQGASIAINGTCLTATKFDINDSIAHFDAIAETLSKTNLGQLTEGAEVNYERAAKIGDEIGGHSMSGHISETSQVEEVKTSAANTEIVLNKPKNIADFILDKGYIGLNGCSLTIANVTDTTFSICLIPETLEVTTFGQTQKGDLINIEVDPQTQAIVETVKKYLASSQ